MKQICITLFITLISSCSKSQVILELLKNGASSHEYSTAKNVQPIVDNNVYEFAGFLDYTKTNKINYYYRRGTDHLTGGVPVYRSFNVAAQTWNAPTQIASNAKDSRDVYGTLMNDAGYSDSTMMFLQWSNNGTGGDWAIDLQIIKCDSNNIFSAPINFDWSGIPVRLQRAFVFGHVVKGDNAGEYYEPLIQFNVDTGSTRYRISIIKTTDRWAHYSEVGVVFNGTTHLTETCLANLGSGKFVAMMRNDLAGSLTGYESSNSCVSWSARQESNLFWYNSGESEMACIFNHDNLFDVIYDCRDADMVSISMGNNTALNFGTAIYQEPQIFARNLGGGSNPSLGYPAAIRLRGTNYYLILYSHEYSNTWANIMWTITDRVTDPSGLPVAPPVISPSAINTTLFRVDITGYTDAQINNIRYFLQDLSTDPSFGSFVTAKYRSAGGYPAVKIQNVRMTGIWDVYNSLTTGTTYYLRIKACNNAGCSAYTTVNVTTL